MPPNHKHQLNLIPCLLQDQLLKIITIPCVHDLETTFSTQSNSWISLLPHHNMIFLKIEPHMVGQALKHPQWQKAMSVEFDALIQNRT